MKLPDAELAIVESEKVTEYLLNAAHPDNGGKAAFFTAQGFLVDEAHLLALRSEDSPVMAMSWKLWNLPTGGSIFSMGASTRQAGNGR